MAALRKSVVSVALVGVLVGCGGGGSSSHPLAFNATVISNFTPPAVYLGSGEFGGADQANAYYEAAPSFIEETLPPYTGGATNQTVAYGIGSNGSFAGFAYEGGQSQDVPIYWSSALQIPAALSLPSGSPSMIAGVNGTSLYGYTTGPNTGGSFGIYQWSTPTSHPTLFSNTFPSSATINTVLPYSKGYIVVVGTTQAETFLYPSSSVAPLAFTDGLGSNNVTATAVGADGTVYGLSSTETAVYWPKGQTTSPKALPAYSDPSYSGTLNAVGVWANAKNELAGTFIGADGSHRSCIWSSKSSQPYDLKQAFGTAESAPGQSISVVALFDDGSLIVQVGSGQVTYYYLKPTG